MIVRCSLLLSGVVVSGLSGCLARTYHKEQANLREVILSLYEEQLKDNLARAYEGEPFIHISYTQLTGEVAMSTLAEASYQETDPPMAGITALWRIFGRASKQNRVNVISVPVLNNESVYQAYIDFALDAALFGRATKEDDSELAKAHKSWKRDEYYYYVKDGDAAKRAFRSLILQTTVSARTVEIETGSGDLTGQITAAEEISGRAGYEVLAAQHFIGLTFDSEVPNSEGRLKLTIQDRDRIFRVQPVEDVPLGDGSTRLVLFYDERNTRVGHGIEVEALLRQLIGATVTLQLEDIRTTRRVPIDAINPLLELERLQLEQLRSMPLRR